MMLIPGNEKKIALSLTMPPSVFCIHHRTMIFKMGLTNTGYGNSTFIMYYERKDNEFGLEFFMDDLNQGEHVELDSTHLGGGYGVCVSVSMLLGMSGWAKIRPCLRIFLLTIDMLHSSAHGSMLVQHMDSCAWPTGEL